MTKVLNSIIIGFEWAQDLTLAEWTLNPGDELRADFRYSARDAAPIFSLSSPGDGITGDGLTVSLVASDEKTGLIAAPTGAVDRRKDALAFLFVAWLVRLSEIVEFLLVRWGAKGPNRR